MLSPLIVDSAPLGDARMPDEPTPFSRPMRTVLWIVMSLAFALGFLAANREDMFERLHIFLFNLCCCGLVILRDVARRAATADRSVPFLALSLAYAGCAAMGFYLPAAVLALALAALVESVRARAFSPLPLDIFSLRTDVAEKFRHAAVLCLSIALALSALVIINNEYGRWIAMRKLTLTMFFLGFSFPMSLMTMALVVDGLRPSFRGSTRRILEAVFWIITVGVILFLAAILLEFAPAEIALATMLFTAVIALLALFAHGAERSPRAAYCASGIAFLVSTGISGITYIFVNRYGSCATCGDVVLWSHAYLSLYGWNLCGLALIVHAPSDAPRALPARVLIPLHWLSVALAALGKLYPQAAVVAVIVFAVIVFALVKK